MQLDCQIIAGVRLVILRLNREYGFENVSSLRRACGDRRGNQSCSGPVHIHIRLRGLCALCGERLLKNIALPVTEKKRLDLQGHRSGPLLAEFCIPIDVGQLFTITHPYSTTGWDWVYPLRRVGLCNKRGRLHFLKLNGQVVIRR